MKLTITSSPHLKSKLNTPYVMFQVIVSLLPAIIASIIFFRYRAVFVILNCILTAVITEEIVGRVRKNSLRVKSFISVSRDGSAVVTGLLLALVLPPSVPWYAASLGSIFAVLVAKHLFGGIGSNIFNPALMGRAFLMAAYPRMLTTFIEPFSLDTVTKATPLALRKFSQVILPLKDLFLGNISGSLGETSSLCLIIGGLYLTIKKIADWRIPLSATITVTVISSIFYIINHSNASVLFHLFSGGFLLGIFFMATDPVTTPVTKKGRYVFGIGCGLLIMIIRYFSGLPEGVMYSILFMNAFVPLINRYTRPKRFGG
jgi:electron transport complex protein RnfD